MKKIEYTLFSQPITRRTFYWLLFLCPFAAMWIYLASRRAVNAEPSPALGSVTG